MEHFLAAPLPDIFQPWFLTFFFAVFDLFARQFFLTNGLVRVFELFSRQIFCPFAGQIIFDPQSSSKFLTFLADKFFKQWIGQSFWSFRRAIFLPPDWSKFLSFLFGKFFDHFFLPFCQPNCFWHTNWSNFLPLILLHKFAGEIFWTFCGKNFFCFVEEIV